ncbi:MAG: DUF4199 domain-containing protein [Bacteroidales bacterium]|nr:DUF4199 domain-containing protein [Bacteroidales bacterium]
MESTEIKEEKMTYKQYAFRWGSIIGFVSFLYYLLGFYTKMEESPMLFDNIYFILSIGLLIYMLFNYRKIEQGEEIKFKRYLSISFIASIVIALFITIYYWLRMSVLDPFYFQNVLNLMEEAMKSSPYGDLSMFKDNPGLIPVLKTSYLFTTFIGSIFGNMIYMLLLSGTMVINARNRKRFYDKYNNKDNDGNSNNNQ